MASISNGLGVGYCDGQNGIESMYTSVNDSASLIPGTPDEAVVRFRVFLRENGWPEQVHWITRESVLISKKCEYWIKARPNHETQSILRATYLEGVKRELGISMAALCKIEASTFAYVFIPADQEEAERLMIDGLKLSTPASSRTAYLAKNSFVWWLLCCIYQNHTNKFIADVLS
jgi:hypothetical protein